MTAEGYNALDEELKRLKTVERPAVIGAIAEARLHGDLSENAEYHAAKDRQGWIEGQIAEIEDKMARAQVIDVSKLSGKQIKFGATVSPLSLPIIARAMGEVMETRPLFTSASCSPTIW